jgi:hypothetical protein
VANAQARGIQKIGASKPQIFHPPIITHAGLFTSQARGCGSEELEAVKVREMAHFTFEKTVQKCMEMYGKVKAKSTRCFRDGL